MRKNAKYLLLTLLTFCFAVKVDAAECSYEKQVELNNLAATVKATYEEVEIDTGETESYVDEEGIIDTDKQIPVKKKGFNVKLLNLNENLYVQVKNEITKTSKDYYYKDSDNGTITIATYPADKIYTYSIVVRGYSDGCSGVELRTINFITPMYNPYSEYSFCNQYPNFEYCQEYTTDSSFNLEDFISKSAAYSQTHKEENKKEIKKEENKFLDFFKENKKILIIIGSIILIAGVTTIVIIIIKKRSRLI